MLKDIWKQEHHEERMKHFRNGLSGDKRNTMSGDICIVFFLLGRVDIFFPVFLIHLTLTVLFLSVFQYYKAILHLSLF